MRVKNRLKLSKYKVLFCIITLAALAGANAQQAHALTGKDITDKMSAAESTAYLAGAVEALAYMRWQKERPEDAGMKCIHDWLYSDRKRSLSRIDAWFRRHPEKPASALLYVLIKKDCGE